jgi:hypothetical protein
MRMLFPCLFLFPFALFAELPTYTIRATADSITVDGRLDEPAWAAAPSIDGFVFPWWTEGKKESTQARMLWDENFLYVGFVAQDRNISANLTERDAPVSRDDCVEVFIAPDTSDVLIYFNFEFNALGTILDRSPRDNRSGTWNCDDIRVAIDIDGTLNDETDVDRAWTTEIALPFSCFAPYAPALPPTPGDMWRLNLYRIGGKVNPQYSAWSNTQTPKPQYHVPARFGKVRFAARADSVR